MNRWMERVYQSSPPFLQNVLVSTYRYARRPIEYGRDFWRYRTLLEETQWWPRERLREWQLERLKSLVGFAYESVPAYRDLYDRAGVRPSDLRSLDDLAKFPVVTKAQIRADREAFTARGVRRFRPVGLNTSGTTGTPFQFSSTRLTEEIEWAFFWRHKGWGGARLWEPMISLGGKVIVPLARKRPPFWRFNHAEKIMWLSAFHMTPENLDLYVERVRRSGIRFLKGYPSNLSIFAQHMAERGVRLPMTAVFTGSEPLFDHVRALIEDRFACKVFDWYGVSERVVTAGQCDRHEGYHIHMENCVVELLDGSEPAEPGRPGEVVATCLSNLAMPLIRYRTGDLSTASVGPCGCGRGLETMGQVQTKWEHVVRMPDGRMISPSVLTHPFKPVLGVLQSQIIQEEPGSILVKVVPDCRFDLGQQRLLIDGFRQRLGDEVRVEVILVEAIPKEPSGKFRWVISKVPNELNRRLDLEGIRA